MCIFSVSFLPSSIFAKMSKSAATVHSIKIHERGVKTTVIAAAADVASHLPKFLSAIRASSSHCGGSKRVVGLDIRKSTDNKVSILTLCFEKSCLIIQLLHMDSPTSMISALLELPDLSFVGMEINHCVDALHRDHGISCRNKFDLGRLAAEVRQKPSLQALGLADLASQIVIVASDVGVKDPGVAFSDWGKEKLSFAQVRDATVDAFWAFFVGNHLLGGYFG